MSLRFLSRDLGLVEPSRISGNYVEGPLLISYSIQRDEGLPTARFFLQYDGSRIPLRGDDNDICALLYDDRSTVKADINEALSTLGEPGEDQLLQQFATQGQHHKPIEHEIRSAVLVKVLMDYHASSGAVPYVAVALRPEERKLYAGIVEAILSGIATGRTAVQVATASSLPALEMAIETISSSYLDFLQLVKEEIGTLEAVVNRVAKVGSDIRKYHQDGFLPLTKYQVVHEQLQVEIIEQWAQELLTTMELGVAALNISLFQDRVLDAARFGAVSALNQEAWSLARTLYAPRFRDDSGYKALAERYESSASLSFGFARHALSIQDARDSVEKQRKRLEKDKGQVLITQKKKAGRLVKSITDTIAKNRKLFDGLSLDGNSRAFDKIRDLLLMKMGVLETAISSLKEDYRL